MSLILLGKQLTLRISKNKVCYKLLFTAYHLANYLGAVIYYILRIYPISPNKIVISNMAGKGYNDHLKYIVEELLKRATSYDIVWLLGQDWSTKTDFPDGIRFVKYGSLRAKYELVTGKIWIDNVRKLASVRKRKGQYYIQTWHGFGPKKYRSDDKYAPLLQNLAVKRDAKMTDVIISNNRYLTEMYHDDFWYNCRILECGFPRNDILFSDTYPQINTKVRTSLSIPLNKKILIYAPTYRNNLSTDCYNLDINLVLDSLSVKFGGEWICLLRLHPFMAGLTNPSWIQNTRIINASNYLDVQELLYVSDVMISDYSSIIFDFTLTNRPCFLYLPDIDNYTSADFCITPKEMPFLNATTNNDLRNVILSFNEGDYLLNLYSFFKKYSLIENGKASAFIADWIEDKINSSVN